MWHDSSVGIALRLRAGRTRNRLSASPKFCERYFHLLLNVSRTVLKSSQPRYSKSTMDSFPGDKEAREWIWFPSSAERVSVPYICLLQFSNISTTVISVSHFWGFSVEPKRLACRNLYLWRLLSSAICRVQDFVYVGTFRTICCHHLYSLPWSWRKRREILDKCTKLHGFTSRKTPVFIATAVVTSNNTFIFTVLTVMDMSVTKTQPWARRRNDKCLYLILLLVVVVVVVVVIIIIIILYLISVQFTVYEAIYRLTLVSPVYTYMVRFILF